MPPDPSPTPEQEAAWQRWLAATEALNLPHATHAAVAAWLVKPRAVIGRAIRKGVPAAQCAGQALGMPAAAGFVPGKAAAPPPAPPADGLLTTAQAAALLGCNPRSVTRAVRRGALKARRIGRLVRFRRADLERMLAVS